MAARVRQTTAAAAATSKQGTGKAAADLAPLLRDLRTAVQRAFSDSAGERSTKAAKSVASKARANAELPVDLAGVQRAAGERRISAKDVKALTAAVRAANDTSGEARGLARGALKAFFEGPVADALGTQAGTATLASVSKGFQQRLDRLSEVYGELVAAHDAAVASGAGEGGTGGGVLADIGRRVIADVCLAVGSGREGWETRLSALASEEPVDSFETSARPRNDGGRPKDVQHITLDELMAEEESGEGGRRRAGDDEWNPQGWN